jgi:hypothetical protein
MKVFGLNSLVSGFQRLLKKPNAVCTFSSIALFPILDIDILSVKNSEKYMWYNPNTMTKHTLLLPLLLELL